LTKSPKYLLDVNVLIALLSEDHMHHQLATDWFVASPGLQWAICSFTEAGFLRYATRPRPGQITMNDATAILAKITQHSGYHYEALSTDWRTMTKPFFQRLFGHKQITDAYLLGLAINHGLTLVTFDKAILHLAGEHRSHVLVLSESEAGKRITQ